MAVASKNKLADRQSALKKLLAALKQRYKGVPVPDDGRPVLETMLYAVCLEDSPVGLADQTFEKLSSDFHDLNEIRVSSITELEVLFSGQSNAEWRALRLRDVLQYVFEKQFAFDFELLRKKTMEQSVRLLSRIQSITPFIRLYTLQAVQGIHLIPVDDRTRDAVVWFGLVEPGSTPDQASESLKSVIRKADATQAMGLVRAFATDPAVIRKLASELKNAREDSFPLENAPARLADLFARIDGRATKASPKSANKKPTRTAKKKSAPKTAPARNAAGNSKPRTKKAAAAKSRTTGTAKPRRHR